MERRGLDFVVLNQGNANLTDLYRTHIGDWPKFYKMDRLCQLGMVASELLLMQEEERFVPRDNRAVILMNHSSSIGADRKFLASITKEDDFFPSPSAFLYTLPNIVTGEIAIRNHYHGETALYVLDGKNQKLMEAILNATMEQDCITSAVTGWLDYEDEAHFEADMYVVCRKSNTSDGE